MEITFINNFLDHVFKTGIWCQAWLISYFSLPSDSIKLLIQLPIFNYLCLPPTPEWTRHLSGQGFGQFFAAFNNFVHYRIQVRLLLFRNFLDKLKTLLIKINWKMNSSILAAKLSSLTFWKIIFFFHMTYPLCCFISFFVAFLAEKIRILQLSLVSSSKVWQTTSRIPERSIPSVTHLSSSILCSSSNMLKALGSRKMVAALSKLTPCFRLFSLAFLGSHWK